MKYLTLFAALVAALGLSACEKTTVQPSTPPTVVQVPVPVPVPVPGPQGAPGPQGEPGAPGKSGSTVVIVPPPSDSDRK